MKFVIVLALLAIVASLGSALFFMMRRNPEDQEGPGDDRRRSRAMFRALALRVALSITLFLCVLLAAKLGYIHPTGWTAGQ